MKNILLNPIFGRFLGAFTSEGNLPDDGNSKITNKNLDFINQVISDSRELFGKDIVTGKPSTPEHKNSDTCYHKFFSRKLSKILICEIGLIPGRRILNNEGIPNLVMSKLYEDDSKNLMTSWFRNYIRMRYWGDGEVRRKRKEVNLTKANALNLNKDILQEIEFNYIKGKKIANYSDHLKHEMNRIASLKNNFPKELFDLQKVFIELFGIKSEFSKPWVKTIYYDNKRKILIVSAIYRLNISGIDNLRKFNENIGFEKFDPNKTKMDFIMKNIAGGRFELPTFTPHKSVSGCPRAD